MLRLVLQRVLTFSALTVFAFALLTIDTKSPSLISEAQACDWPLYQECMVACGTACFNWQIPECLNPPPPEWPCCSDYCDSWCRTYSGC